ncbi:hypothetical protein CAPTEDRAFT_171602 [Capitella teleta]|uniref:Strictosidine synthase conserved region domain-containing protein n=1 Tax=Capitella teleta TaxID=283909 RepID=R7UD09_CAPTE|nr:hypothetical protein CAPTEDRAFT_171602 [Capitella teleta]|eukprot:ELU04275.1 hypothetical protein CAPTEDRAFT_171602 [Capitella teleta]
MASNEVRQRRIERPSDDVKYELNERKPDEQENIPQDTGFLMLFKIGVLVTFVLPIVFLLIVVIVVPSKVNAVEYSLPNPPVWEGPLKPNDLLLQSERIFEGKIKGPESMVNQNGHIYTGTADGKVLHIYKGEIQVLATLGQPPCGSFADEPNCGRPLGMRIDKEGYLVVIDTYLGLFRINVATGDVFQIFSTSMKIGNRDPVFMNDLDVASDGMMYITDSSIFQRREFPLDVLEGRNHGRLIQYDPETNSSRVILENLAFANGVQLSKKEDFVLVAETTRFRIIKYHLKGPKTGRAEVFIENLPVSPDNIRRSSTGGFWVAGAVCRGHHMTFNLFDWIGPKPWLRSLVSRQLPLWLVHKALMPCGMILELNQQGDIVRAFMDPSGEKVAFLSEVEDDSGILYLGSFSTPFMSRLNINKLAKRA